MPCQLPVADTIDDAEKQQDDAKKYIYKQSAVLGQQV